MNSDKLIEQELNNYHDVLTAQHIGVNDYKFDDLVNHFRKLIGLVSESYEDYRRYIPRFLSLLEKNDSTSIAIMGESFFDFLDQLGEKSDFTKLDTSFINHPYESEISESLFKAFEDTAVDNGQIRISNFVLNKEKLSEETKLGIISSISDFITAKAKTLEWDEETIEIVLIQLASIHDLLKDQNEIYLFYYMLGAVFDRLSSSEYFQQSRDLAEEIILASYNDEVSHLGYLNSFRCYSNNSSSIASLLYANLCLHKSLSGKSELQAKFIKELIWHSMKFFRNISLNRHVERIYKSLPNGIDWDEYEKRSLEHTYLTSLLSVKDPKLPSKFLEFLQRNREDIIKSGLNDCLPLLISLYNVKRIYPQANFSSTGLGSI